MTPFQIAFLAGIIAFFVFMGISAWREHKRLKAERQVGPVPDLDLVRMDYQGHGHHPSGSLTDVMRRKNNLDLDSTPALRTEPHVGFTAPQPIEHHSSSHDFSDQSHSSHHSSVSHTDHSSHDSSSSYHGSSFDGGSSDGGGSSGGFD